MSENSITIRQSHQLVSTLITNVDWSRVDVSKAQEFIRDPEIAGRLFTALLSLGLNADIVPKPILPPRAPVHDSRLLNKAGIVRFTLSSNGWSGEQWVAWFKAYGYDVDAGARKILFSPDFKPAPADTLYEVVILMRKRWKDIDRLGRDTVRKAAKELGFSDLSPEVVCLIRQAFSDDDLEAAGLRVLGMHVPLDAGVLFSKSLLGCGRLSGGHYLYTTTNDWTDWLGSEEGYAFLDVQ